MAIEKVILAEIKINGDWINIKDNNNREISVGLKDKTSGSPVNQKLKEALSNAKAGDSIEMEVREWKKSETETKYFGNEPKAGGGGGKGFAPKDKSFEAGQTAMLATATLYQHKTAEELKNLHITFEKLHALLMTKITK